jgi:hypothetical protein
MKGIEIDEKLISKINKIEQRSKPASRLDLNQQVEDLLGGAAEYKNLERSRAEFPMSSEALYNKDLPVTEPVFAISSGSIVRNSASTPVAAPQG